MENISAHISFNEAIITHTGLKNEPNGEQIANMKALAEMIFEPLRKGLGNQPIQINSMFRSPEVNHVIGGASFSQHTKGEAVDLKGIHCTNAEIFDYIKNHLPFDQLIWEFGNHSNPDWVHVSFSRIHNRGQVLRAKKIGGKSVYEVY